MTAQLGLALGHAPAATVIQETFERTTMIKMHRVAQFVQDDKLDQMPWQQHQRGGQIDGLAV